MVSSRLIGTIAVCGAAVLVALVLSPRHREVDGRNQARISPQASFIDPGDLDFGDAWSQPAFPWRIALRNPTAQTLILEDVHSTCECTSIEPRSATIASGETASFQLILNLGASPEVTLPRDFAVDLTFALEGQPALKETLRGRVLSCPIRFAPQPAMLGEIINSEPESYVRTIALSSDVPLVGLTATCERAESAAVTVTPGTLLNAGAGELQLSLNPSLPVGPLELFLSILARPSEGSKPMLLNLPVRGEVVPDVEAIPRTVMFGAVPVGQQLEEEITFQSRTGREILSIETGAVVDGFHVGPTRNGELPAGRAAVRVHGSPTLPGEQTVELRFWVAVDGLETPVGVSVPLTYYGLADGFVSEVRP